MGYIQVYTGNGKGKTTASLGLMLRALGWSKSVAIVHFMKFEIEAGERRLAQLFPDLIVESFGTNHFVDKKKPDKENIDAANAALEFAIDILKRKKIDLLILDELNVALDFGLISWNKVEGFLINRPKHTEVVITGRNAPKKLVEMADLVTVMEEKKHYFKKKVAAREGIEY